MLLSAEMLDDPEMVLSINYSRKLSSHQEKYNCLQLSGLGRHTRLVPPSLEEASCSGLNASSVVGGKLRWSSGKLLVSPDA